jgi:hypothetical protein
MPEGETLPKSNKSKDWLDYADKKKQDFIDYHSERNLIGRIKNPNPLSDTYSRLLSNNELMARKKGMELKRAELRGMAKGGKVRATGSRKLHKGEVVSRAAKTRSCGRR